MRRQNKPTYRFEPVLSGMEGTTTIDARAQVVQILGAALLAALLARVRAAGERRSGSVADPRIEEATTGANLDLHSRAKDAPM